MGSADDTEGLITPLVDAHVNLDDSSTKEWWTKACIIMSSWLDMYADFLCSSLEQTEDVDKPDVTLPLIFGSLS